MPTSGGSGSTAAEAKALPKALEHAIGRDLYNPIVPLSRQKNIGVYGDLVNKKITKAIVYLHKKSNYPIHPYVAPKP